MQPGHIDAENERKWSTSMRINSPDRGLSRPQCGCSPCSRNTGGNTSRWPVCSSSRKRSRVGVQHTSESSRSYFSVDIVHSCSSSRIALSIFYLLAVAILVGSSRSSTKDRESVKKGNTTLGRNSNVVAISSSSFLGEPLKEKTEGTDKGKARWMRVKSARAAHPAMYVPGDGLVYCPIAKVACAEWRKTLRWMLGIPDWDTGPIHEQGKNGIPLLAGRLRSDVEIMMNDDSWVKFVVVRDPADRLLSGFLNKCVGREWQNCPYVEFMPHRFNGAKHRDEKTDAMFISAIREQPRVVFKDFLVGVNKDVNAIGCRVNSHWRPQYCFCSLARFLPSYHVIPFSNMSVDYKPRVGVKQWEDGVEDSSRVAKIIRDTFLSRQMESVALVDRMKRPSPERAERLREFFLNRFSRNYDVKQQGATKKRDKYFSKEVLEIIREVYAKDYLLFGQHFEKHEAPPLVKRPG